MDFYHEDLIIEILLRLPVKSLLRFRSLSKRWHAIISAADFINKHSHHQSNNMRLLVYWSGKYAGDTHFNIQYCFSVFSSNLDRLETPDYLELPGHVYSFLGPCKGIFCIYVQYMKLALWNPATKRLMPLPFCDLEDTNQLPRFMQYNGFKHGFGMDPLTHELKIVVIDNGSCSTKFAMYKSSSKIPGTFKRSKKLRALNWTVEEPIFVNGFVYWRRINDFTLYSVILAFDLHNEVFEVIQMPEAISSRLHGHLDSYDDSLVVFSSEHHGPVMSYDCFDIWTNTMKEKGNWTKLCTVVLPCMIYGGQLKFWNRNEILVSEMHLVYDPDSKAVTNLIVEKKEGAKEVNTTLSYYYRETLAPIKGESELQEYDIMSAVSREFFTPDRQYVIFRVPSDN